MKEGFKKTAIGEIPEGWKVVKLGDVTAKIGDGIHTTPNYVESSEYFFVNGNNLIDGRIKVSEKTKCVSEREFLKHKIELNKGSILLLINGTVGNIAFYKGEKVILGKSAAFINFNGVVDKNYIYYLLQSNPVNQYFEFELTGTTIKNLSLKTLRNTPIPYPPLPEQQKIAEILSTVDEKIEVIGEQISQTQELKRGLMQRLLTKGIGHTQFKDSPLGKIPESWEVVRIEKYIDLLSGFPFKSDRFNEEGRGTKVLRGVNITVGKLRWSDKIDRYWEEEFHEYDKYSLREGDLVISMDGSLVGRNYARVTIDALPLLLVQRVACIRAKGKLDLEYLNQIIGSSLFIDYVDAVKTSSGIPHISAKQIREFKIALPPFPEQQKIAAILSSVDNKLDVVQEKKHQYQELKKGLMQQLLTGKVRVTNLITKAVPA